MEKFEIPGKIEKHIIYIYIIIYQIPFLCSKSIVFFNNFRIIGESIIDLWDSWDLIVNVFEDAWKAYMAELTTMANDFIGEINLGLNVCMYVSM